MAAAEGRSVPAGGPMKAAQRMRRNETIPGTTTRATLRTAGALVGLLLGALGALVALAGPAGADPAPPVVAVGQSHTCALFDGGAVKCWGAGYQGQLGNGVADVLGDEPGEMGALRPVDLGTGRTATDIAAGWSHTCVILDDGSVKCWGYGFNGQLGNGDTTDRGDGPGEMGDALPTVDLGTGRTATAISADASHTCALLDDATVKCWGGNEYGQLGQGDTARRGDGPGEMGDALPAIDLGTGRTAATIVTGQRYTCALLDNATVKCWGGNPYGQTGLGSGGQSGDEPNEMGDALPIVALGTGRTATSVSAGDGHTCALLDNATVKCWGFNNEGSLGLGDTEWRGDQSNEMGDDLPTVDLGTGRTATSVSALSLHTCAVLDDGSTKCWGYDANGQLGLGDTENRGDEPDEMGDALPAIDVGTGRTVSAIDGNVFHTCAVLDDDSITCWGENGNGQLGLDDTEDRGDEPGEMGDALRAVDFSDVTDPTVTITTPADGATYNGGGSLTVDFSCDDNVEVTSCVGDVADGQPMATLVAGTSTFSVTATDSSGNDTTVTSTYTVAPRRVCDGRTVTVNLNLGQAPTGGDDVILGTPTTETINGRGGNDRICAGGGNDTVNGGPGNDRIFGQGGRDRLTGSTGNDVVDGGAGTDTVNGNDGADRGIGGDGNDILNGQAGVDNLAGGPGADRLDGGSQRDLCDGGTQRDTATACEVRRNLP
jgi:alpha-tubulin suppressor-like RCC1 family protein